MENIPGQQWPQGVRGLLQWAIRDWVWLVALIALGAMDVRQEIRMNELQVQIFVVDKGLDSELDAIDDGYANEVLRLHHRIDHIREMMD